MKHFQTVWRQLLCGFVLVGLIGLSPLPVEAADALPTGEKEIVLITADGKELAIGRAVFTEDGDGRKITVDLDAPDFIDEFLSMRPFRCLPDPEEMWCHLAYPYETRLRITDGDLIDLEYALLFLFKKRGEHFIDAWNGLYFKLEPNGAGGLKGNVHEVDLNVLAVPPEKGELRPILHGALTPVDADTHRFARVEIR